MNVSTLKPPAFVNVRAGGTLYADLESKIMLSSPWAGGTNIGTIGTDKRGDGAIMRAVIVDDPRISGSQLIVGWTGDDHCTIVGPALGQVTVIGSGLTVTQS